MKKRILSIGVIMLIANYPLFAQDNKTENQKSTIAVSLGAAANYYYGQGDRNFGEFENERVNWQINGLLGLTILRDKNGRRTMLAGFGAYGFNNESTIKKIFSDQQYVTTRINQAKLNNFYQLEGGLLIGEVLRLSTGVGQQHFEGQAIAGANGDIRLDAKSLKYNSTTVGFNFNLSAVALIINVNFAHGIDYEKTIVTPSAGLMLRL
ncbi:hypothetical protein EXU57_00255 [Segetibacter sp. 3557_3]|uniref:hypothetical protein n=1 Tax=Segetibacter sp. 3557_3 TaxID=2547429 RepID=UPI001058F3B4|nr:hypothetical protein [Segetibacter sp. 3557_3]TDH28546.1 hypothetical protein EXU57_00255 [Segetibacter sp. 3557_3]